MFVHGGAGAGKSATIKVITSHAEKILRKAGDHPNKPRILLDEPKSGSKVQTVNAACALLTFIFVFVEYL